METIKLKNIFTKSVIFEYECENNNMKTTLLQAVKNEIDLRYCDLSNYDLRGCYLRGCDLSNSSLHNSNLRSCDLIGCDLRNCDLRGCDFSFSDMIDCDFSFSDLRGCYLHDCDLRGCNFSGCDLRGCNLDFECLEFKKTRILPEGQIIGWKKCKNEIIVKLSIPAEAKRSHAFGRICRAEFADVVEIFGADKAFSDWDENFIYEVGKRVYPDSFDENWQNECGNGIHFFITREEAENYEL